MARIQTNTGLITGLPITDLVDKLMQLAAKPRDLLVSRTNTLQKEQAAVTELSALLLAVKYITENLGKADLYDQRKATSSSPDILSVTTSGQPAIGTYRFTPLRMVQSQQLLSTGFKTDTESLGGGKLTFRFGDHVQRSAPLELYGGGAGFIRGKFLITDRSGASAQIDLSTAQTIDDVLDAINGNQAINVTAVAHGDGIRLIDNTGQSVSNLTVREVGGSSTAASLGLAGIDVAGSVADGQDMLWLYEGLDLDLLNDGRGVRVNRVLDDISYELRDGTTGTIDLSPIIVGGSEVDEETTLGEILDVIGAAAPGKLKIEIAPDGDRLVVSDLTEGSGTFQLTSLNDSAALKDLGLDGPADSGQISGRRILGGAKSVLLASLGGGQGLGQLGGLQLTDRSGASDLVDLSAAETLEQVIDAINAANVAITAQVNQARNGIELLDTSGSQAGNLVVANADATATAEKLNIAIDDDVASVNSGDLHLQVVAENTRLSDLNGGAGVALGTLTIRDSTGKQARLDLRVGNVQTVGDVIAAINRLDLSAGVHAEINQTGDGIRIVDQAGGPGTLYIAEGNTTTAKDLNLLGTVNNVDVDGQTAQVIDGSMTYTIELDPHVTSNTLLADLNYGAGVALGTFTIVDTAGQQAVVDLTSGNVQTIGDLINAINELSLGVHARINDTNTGILIEDLEHGQGTLAVVEGETTTAADLHLLVDAEQVDVGGQPTQVIDGAMGSGVRSLEDLRQAINALGVGVTAMTFLDGSSNPFRLALTSQRAGTAGELLVDTSQVNFSLQETVRAQDALLLFGDPDNVASSVLVSSSSNRFQNVLSGVTLEIKQASTAPVTITVSSTDTNLVASVQTFVDNYNKFRQRLAELTAYDAETDTRSVLTSDPTALRLDTDLSSLLSRAIYGAGSIQSLAEVGVSLQDDGTLEFDEAKLRAKLAADPQAVEEFFSTAEFGVSDRFEKLLDSLASEDNSLLTRRLEALQNKIAQNESRTDFMDERLDDERERLLLEFYRLETTIAKLQTSLSALDAFQPLEPLALYRND